MESRTRQGVRTYNERILMFRDVVHRELYDSSMRREWDLSTYSGRIEWLLYSRRLRQADVARALGKSSGNMSDVAGGKREFGWEDTSRLIRVLETNGDFFHGLDTEEGRDLPLAELAPKDKAPEKPNYLHPESDDLAELCDSQPEWLRRQMLAVAQAQVDSVRDVTPGDWDRRLRDAIRVAELTLGPDDAALLLTTLQMFLGNVGYSGSAVHGGELSRRQ